MVAKRGTVHCPDQRTPKDHGTRGPEDHRTTDHRTGGPEPVRTRAPGEALGAEGKFVFDPCQIFLSLGNFFDPYQIVF